jgi:hypothetical protein
MPCKTARVARVECFCKQANTHGIPDCSSRYFAARACGAQSPHVVSNTARDSSLMLYSIYLPKIFNALQGLQAVGSNSQLMIMIMMRTSWSPHCCLDLTVAFAGPLHSSISNGKSVTTNVTISGSRQPHLVNPSLGMCTAISTGSSNYSHSEG